METAKGDAEGGGARDATAVGLDGLLSWFVEHGGSMTKLCLEDLGGEMSLSLLTGQALSKGEVVMSIPISLCMTVDSVRRPPAGNASSPGVVIKSLHSCVLLLLCPLRARSLKRN